MVVTSNQSVPEMAIEPEMKPDHIAGIKIMPPLPPIFHGNGPSPTKIGDFRMGHKNEYQGVN
jgi:hypothetical protein